MESLPVVGVYNVYLNTL